MTSTDAAEARNRGREAETPTQIPRLGWRDILLRTWQQAAEDNVSLISAGVAFYGFLALVPLLGAFVLTYALVADPGTVVEHIRTLFVVLPSDAAKLIADQMAAVTQQSAGKTSLGLALAIILSLYGGMKGASAIVTALNIAYEEEEGRGFIRTTFLSFLITLGGVLMGLLSVAAIAALAFVEALLPGAPSAVLFLIRTAAWAGASIAAVLAVACLYRFGPDRHDAKWRWLTPGAAFATFGWLAVSLGFGLYTSNFADYNATYGALGAVVVLLMWLYLSAWVLLFGAELNSEIEHQTEVDTTRGQPKPMGERRAEVADTVGKIPPGLFSWKPKAGTTAPTDRSPATRS